MAIIDFGAARRGARELPPLVASYYYARRHGNTSDAPFRGRWGLESRGHFSAVQTGAEDPWVGWPGAGEQLGGTGEWRRPGMGSCPHPHGSAPCLRDDLMMIEPPGGCRVARCGVDTTRDALLAFDPARARSTGHGHGMMIPLSWPPQPNSVKSRKKKKKEVSTATGPALRTE
jgi:hypothetical protein